MLRRLPPPWAWAAAAGGGALATGLLPAGAARVVALDRAGPVLAFLAAATALAVLADRAGVFEVAAAACARSGRGSVPALFGLVAALGVLVTVTMSLDTTAVLLTPVVLTLTRRLGLAPLPFALLVVWLANVASLLLPVSNLTNLLAAERSGDRLGTVAFAGRMLLPQVAAVAVAVAVLAWRFRSQLRGHYPAPDRVRVGDRPLCAVCAVAALALAPGVLLGAPPWSVALPAAAVCLVATLLRRRPVPWSALVPWRLVVLVEGLFLLVTALGPHGLDNLLARAAGGPVLRTAAVAAAASNLVDNLPAYLALDRAVPAGSTARLLGLLIGTDAGPLVLLWGSLATLLWRDRCADQGLQIRAGEFARVGLLGAPLVVLAAVAALLLTG